MSKKLLGVLSIILYSICGYSVPSDTKIITYNQADETSIFILQHGDEFYHWITSVDGYTLLPNENNILEYAKVNNSGDLVLSGIKARNIGERLNSENKFLKRITPNLQYSEQQRQQLLNNNVYKRSSIRLGGFPTIGENKLIMILARFSDSDTTYSQEDFIDFMNTPGGTNDKGSFRDYYLENSYGLLDVTTTVTAWVTLPHNRAYYANEGPTFALHAVQAADDLGIDFSEFDNDGNGKVDGIALIHTGEGQEASGDSDDIWSHSWEISAGGYTSFQRTIDGVEVDAYTVQPEIYGSGITTIGVMCHEFGHNLGAPDFYDTNYETDGSYDGTGRWDLMAGGTWNGSPAGSQPAHTNMYQKIVNDWVEPTILETNGDYSLNHAALNQEAYILQSPISGEYFLLENRQNYGFDEYLPGHGLLIYHVDEMFIQYNLSQNTVNATEHQGLYPKSATASINSSGCPFPGSGQKTQFDDNTQPNSNTWNGTFTTKPIYNIQESDSIITFYAQAEGIGNPIWNITEVGEHKFNLSWEQNENNDPVILLWSYGQEFPTLESGIEYTEGYVFNNGVEVLYAGSEETSFVHENIALGEKQYYKLISDSEGMFSSGMEKEAMLDCKNDTIFPYKNRFEFHKPFGPGECWQIMENTLDNGGYGGNNLEPVNISNGDNTWFVNTPYNEDLYDGTMAYLSDQSMMIAEDVEGLQWLISPLFKLPSGFADLEFYPYYQTDGVEGYKNTKLSVYIQSNGVWDSLYVLNGAENNLFNDRIKLNLDAYLSQDIKVAFVYEGGDAYQLAIDNFAIYASHDARKFDVEFYVIHDEMPIEGVNINFKNRRQLTNQLGKTIFKNIDTEQEIYYVAKKDGYVDQEGFVDVNKDEDLVISMHPLSIVPSLNVEISVSPNPVNNHLVIKNESEIEGHFMVFDFSGKIVKAGTFIQKETSLNCSDLSNGVYFVKLVTLRTNQSIKIIKQ